MLLLPRGVQTTGVHLPGEEKKNFRKESNKESGRERIIIFKPIKIECFSDLSLSTMFQVKSFFAVSRGRPNLRTVPATKGFFYFYTKGGPKIDSSLFLSFSNFVQSKQPPMII